MSRNSAIDFTSNASTMATATPLAVHASVRLSSGTPSAEGGSTTVRRVVDEPTVMSTSSPVAAWMRSATSRMRSRLAASGPVTSATRTRTLDNGGVSLMSV
ncbi:hypothetical protein [Propioniciclava sp.]|uniref:hypothetical protein n=1 Tax=Propioniciclava sp. TaxID=2038686 RepID=UPI002632F1A2|nr:hypothetical protein [Propioniciclava sp.]